MSKVYVVYDSDSGSISSVHRELYGAQLAAERLHDATADPTKTWEHEESSTVWSLVARRENTRRGDGTIGETLDYLCYVEMFDLED